MKDVHIIDLELADRLVVSYADGIYNRADALHKLINDAGLDPASAEHALEQVDTARAAMYN